MDIGTIRGLITLALFLAFMGMVMWAWSARRKPEFDAAARLPLEDLPLEAQRPRQAHSDQVRTDQVRSDE